MRSGNGGALALVAGLLMAGQAMAACEGSLGRGWGSGSGNGKYAMAAGDKACQVAFPSFINDAAKTKIAATEMKLTRAPKNGTISLSANGPVYTPSAGFKGNDKFCIRNTSPQVKGQSLSGCVTVSVN